jgi:hypothetical protein
MRAVPLTPASAAKGLPASAARPATVSAMATRLAVPISAPASRPPSPLSAARASSLFLSNSPCNHISLFTIIHLCNSHFVEFRLVKEGKQKLLKGKFNIS